MKTLDLNQNARTTFYDDEEDGGAMKALLDAACDRQRAPNEHPAHDEDSNISAASSVTQSSDDSHIMDDDDDFSMRIDSERRKIVTPSPSTPGKGRNETSGICFKVLGRKMTFHPPASPDSISKSKRGTTLYSFARSWTLAELTKSNLESMSSQPSSPTDKEANISPNSPVQISLQFPSGTDLLAEKKKPSTEELKTQLRNWSNRARQEQRERSRRKKEQYVQQETARNMELLCNESDTL